MKKCYREKSFQSDTLDTIETANDIIAEYAAQGFSLTLRQLYYQFVARALIPNTERSYKRLGAIVNDGRMAGLIDWNAIEDRTRWLRKRSTWDSPAEIVRACASQYTVDRWRGQKYRPEVWIEKDALVGVIEGVCNDLHVPYFACRGYVSQSEQWRAGLRFRSYALAGQRGVVFHLGDHDPSGIDMTRDNDDRLLLFAEGCTPAPVVDRLALNSDQVEEYEPPPNPAKLSDSRCRDYVEKYGESSWELDALEPVVLADLVRRSVEELIDPDAWAEVEAEESAARMRLEDLAAELEDE